MKRVTLTGRSKVLHVEAPGCIINIRTGLSDHAGREVTAIEILSDDQDRGGEWCFADGPMYRSMNVRLVKRSPKGKPR